MIPMRREDVALKVMEHKDRNLGGLHPPLCDSCQQQPATISRKFQDGWVFLICFLCR